MPRWQVLPAGKSAVAFSSSGESKPCSSAANGKPGPRAQSEIATLSTLFALIKLIGLHYLSEVNPTGLAPGLEPFRDEAQSQIARCERPGSGPCRFAWSNWRTVV